MKILLHSVNFLLLGVLCTVLCLGAFASTALAQPSYTINYQGKLTTPAGVAVSNADYDMVFKLYTAPTGGSPIWTETRSAANDVTVTSGLFSVMLGSVSSLASVNFNQTLYLGVTIEADAEMTPRKILGTVPSAFEAKQLGGVASTSFLRSDTADSASGLLTFTGGLISTASSSLGRLNFLNATGTSLYIGGDRITDFSGTNLEVTGNALGLSSTYLGQTSITTLGTITTGTWTGTAINSTYLDSAVLTASEVSDSAELAALLSDETGFSSGALAVFSISPTITGTADFVAGDFSSTLTMSGSAANITLGSNWLSGDGGDEGVYVDGSGNVGIGTTTPDSPLTLNNSTGNKINFGKPGSITSGLRLPTSSSLELYANGTFYLSVAGVGTNTYTFGNGGYQTNSGSSAGLTLYSSSDSTGLDLAVRKASLPTSSYVYSSQGGGSYPFDNWGNLILGAGSGRDVVLGRGNQVVIQNGGNIGIGTTTPNQKLAIFNSAADSAIEFSSLTGSPYKWTAGIDYSDAGKFKISSSSALGTNDRFVINGNGYVGIGTASPAQPLDVSGNINVSSGSSIGMISNAAIKYSSSNIFEFLFSGSNRVQIGSSYMAVNSSGSYRWSSTSNGNGAADVYLQRSAGNTITLSSDGSTGAANLIVNGTISTTGGLTIDATTETNIESAIDTLGSLTSASTLATVGTITSGTWQGTAVADTYVADVLTIGAGSTIANDLATPSAVKSTGQGDELCLTYEETGLTFEWQSCASGSLTTASIDTSSELDTIVTDNTGSGALVFGTNPTFTGNTVTYTSLTASRALFLGSASQATTTALSASLLNSLTDETGTGVAVFSTSPVLTTPNLGTPSAITLTSGTGLPISTGLTGAGTGVLTALGVNIGTAGSFVVNGGALGTPSSGTLTNATGLPIATGVSGLGTNVATFLGTPSSANLATALTGETGTGGAVFSISPAFSGTPTFAALSATSTVTLSGTAANIALGSNFISNGGADEGISVAAGGNVTISGTLGVTGGLTIDATTETNIEAAIDTLGSLTSASTLATVGTITSGTWQGTAIDITRGGLGAAFTDPNADRLMFWDDSAGAITGISTLTGAAISGTTLTVNDVTCTDCLTSTEIADEYLFNTGDTISGNLTFSGTTANIVLGSNYLSGDGGDEGVYVSSTGLVAVGTSTSLTTTFTVAGTTSFRSTTSSNGVTIAPHIGAMEMDNGFGYYYINRLNNADIIFGASGGSVGIGPDNVPENLLDVHATNSVAAIAITSLGTDTDSLLKFELADGTATFSVGVDDSDSDKFKISTTALGTNDRFTIDSAGNVGIGDSSPLSLFTVGSGDLFQVNSSGVIASSNNLTPNAIFSTGQADEECLTYEATGTTFEWQTCGGGLTMGDTITSATAGSVFFAGTAGILEQDNAGLFYDNAADRLGIGDITPDDLLNISSASAQAALAITSLGTDTDALIKFELADGTATFSMGVDDSDGDKFKISTTGLGTNDRFIIDSTGDTTIGGDLLPGGSYTNNLSAYDLGATGSRWNALWAGTLNVGTSTWSIKQGSGNRLSFFDAASGGGTENVSFLDNGNVGIGTTSPSSKLTVAGDISLTGALMPAVVPSGQSTRSITTFSAQNSSGDGAAALGSDGYPVIAYQNGVSTDLMFLKCGNASCSSGNATTSINTKGYTPSITIGSDGYPVMAYMQENAGGTDWALVVTKCGNASCTSGNTTGTRDTSGVVVGGDSSIAIGTDNYPVIAYNDDDNANLKVLKCGNAACSSGNTTTTVDSTGDVGQLSSIVIGTDGYPVIAYKDLSNTDLKVLKCGNAACSSGNTTTSITTAASPTYTYIGIGTDDYPVVVYTDGSTLEILKCGNSSCSSGNTQTTLYAVNGMGAILGDDGNPVIAHSASGVTTVIKCEDAACATDPVTTDISDLYGDVSYPYEMLIGTDNNPTIIASLGWTLDQNNLLRCIDDACTLGTSYSSGVSIGSATTFFNNVYASKFWGKNFTLSNFDLAESYEVRETGELEAGDVVAFDEGGKLVKAGSADAKRTVGVISTEPGVLLSKWEEDIDTLPVALSGRVPVKVASSSELVSGDLLALSGDEGVARKAKPGEATIGVVISVLSEGKVEVMVRMSEADPLTQLLGIAENDEREDAGDTFWNRMKTLTTNFVDGVLSVFKLKADRVEVQEELCVDGTCINGDDLRELLQKNSVDGQAPTPDPVLEPTPDPVPETGDGSPVGGSGEGPTTEIPTPPAEPEPTPVPPPEEPSPEPEPLPEPNL